MRGSHKYRNKFRPNEIQGALNLLLTGKNVAIEHNRETGNVNLKPYDDPEMMREGLELYLETVGLIDMRGLRGKKR